MADGGKPDYGSSQGNYGDTLRRMYEEAAAAAADLDRKEQHLAETEERADGVEGRARTTRTGLAGATRELSEAISGNISRLEAETAAVRANTAELERNLSTRRAIVEASGGIAAAPTDFIATGATQRVVYVEQPRTATGGGGGRRPPRTPIVAAGGFEEDPQANERLSAATRQLAEAELAAAQARREATQQLAAAARGERVELDATEQLAAARRVAANLTERQLQALRSLDPTTIQKGADWRVYQQLARAGLVEHQPSPDPANDLPDWNYRRFRLSAQGQEAVAAAGGPVVDPTAAVEAREAARRQLALARQAVAEAEQQVQFNQQISAAKAQQAQADRQAADASVATARAAEQAAREEEAAWIAARQELEAHARAGSTLLAVGRPGQLALPPAGGTSGTRLLIPTGVAAASGAPGIPTEEEQEQLANYRRLVAANAESLVGLEERQAASNAELQRAGALYADVSTRLTRHGALTSEFIQALAQGQVSMREFGDQMVQTIGKFGGWAIAGSAVFGVVGLFRDLVAGATETQGAIQNLGRFIPGLGGPAAGGNGLVGAASDQLRAISQQFNVPIGQVADVQQVAARRYPTLSGSGTVTQAILAAERLDQIPASQGEQYILGIGSGLHLGPQGIVGVVNQLNALQSEFGARVSQTLPAFARAAPIAQAEGLDKDTLAALVALGVRAGIPGAQVGTALLRSAGTFAFRPQGELELRSLGINPQLGEVGDLYRQVFGLINRGRTSDGRQLQGTDIVRLAQALGGPLLGSRTILPILEQEALQPGTFNRALGIARNPRPYQEDLNAVLSTVAERFKSIGIALQSFGSELAQAGLLAPITGLLDGLRLLTQAVSRLTQPIADVVGEFNRLPSVVRDAVGVFAAFTLTRRLLNTRLGGTAQQLIGRLPGLEFAQNNPRFTVQGTASRLDRELLPFQRSETERASQAWLRAQARVTSAEATLAGFGARAPQYEGRDDPEAQAFAVAHGKASDRLDQLTERAAIAQQEYNEQALRLAEMEAQLTILKDNELDWQTRLSFAVQQGFVATEEANVLREQVLAQLRTQLAGGTAAGVGATAGLATARSGSVAGEAEVATAATMATAVGMAANAFVNDRTSVRNITQAVQQETQITPEQRRAAAQARLDAAAAGAPSSGRTFYVPPSDTESPWWSPFERSNLPSQSLPFRTPGAFLASRGLSFAGEEGGQTSLAALGASRLGQFANRVTSAVNWGQAPIAGLLASQLLGSAIPGGVGSFIQNIGGESATGAVIAQMLGKGGAPGVLLGATAGALGGSFQRSTGQGLTATGGALVGGGIGAALGLAGGPFDAITVPLGSTIGAFVGSTVGSVIGQVFGNSSPSPQDITNAAQRRVRRALQVDAPGQLQAQSEADIEAAFTGGGQAQQGAQTRVNVLLNRLTAETQLYGEGSPQGRAARSNLNALVSAAVDQAGTDPATALQVVQSATQAHNQVITQSLQSSLLGATTPRAALSASNTAVSRVRALQEPFTTAVQTAQYSLAQDRVALMDAINSGKQGVIAVAEQKVSQDQQALSSAQSLAHIAGAANQIQEASAATSAWQQIATQIQSETSLAQAQAGGNQLQALAAQRRGAQQTLTDLGRDTAFRRASPVAYGEARNSAQQQLAQTNTQTAATQLQEIQAQGAELVSTAPVGDPVAQARLQAQALQQQLAFMQRNRHAFDPGQIAQVIAQVNDAEKNVVTTIADYATQMAQIAAQIASAQDFGNAMQQASDMLAGAEQALAVAATPEQRQQARLGIASAIEQQYQAGQQRIQAQGQLQQALNTGNTVAQAQASLSTARQLVASAHGIDNQIAAETALASAQAQYRQALEQRYISLGQLAASTTSSPLQQLQDQMAGVIRALSVARGVDERTQLQTQLNGLKLQYQSTLISQREATTQFQLDMYQITYAQAISQLESLLHVKDITLQQQQQIREQIRQLEQTDTGGGQFDLAPNLSQNLKLPTPYDVARAVHTANQEFGRRMSAGYSQALQGADYGGAVAGGSHHVSVANSIVINVRDASDLPGVADALDRVTGSHLRARLRASGIRGT